MADKVFLGLKKESWENIFEVISKAKKGIGILEIESIVDFRNAIQSLQDQLEECNKRIKSVE